LGPDSVLILIDKLRSHGFSPERWECTSLELNVDSRKIRIDASYSFQLVEGVILKAYQHAYNARVEIADRRKAPAREIMDLFHAIAGGLESKEALAKVNALEVQIQKLDKTTRLALSIARNARDKSGKATIPASGKKKKSVTEAIEPPAFSTAAQLKDPRRTMAGKNTPASSFTNDADIHKERVTAAAEKPKVMDHE
jgi:hypothetical protein